MKRKLFSLARAEHGQSLIIIAAVMVGLIALMGLAIDGGNLFMQRRRVQNASDASALAGTRLLAEAINTCNADPAGADLVIVKEVNRYAERNGVKDTNGIAGDAVNDNVVADYVNKDGTALGRVGGGTVPAGATGISVDAQNDHQTYFLQVVGVAEAGVSGHAMAMTGPIIQFPGGGVLPVAVHVNVVQTLGADQPFRFLDVTNDKSGGFFCADENGNGRYDDENIDLCIGDPSASNAHRGWLNLNYIYNPAHRTASDPLNRSFEQNVPNRGCGPDPNRSTDDGVQGWASRNACPYPYPLFAGGIGGSSGDYIHGQPGTRQSSLDAIESTYEGHIAYIPLFDHIYMSDYMAEHFTAPEEPNVEGANLGGDHWPRAGGGGYAYLYHVVGFVAVRVNNIDKDGSNHYLDGQFQTAVIGDGVFLPGIGFQTGVCQPPMIFSVSLWE